MPATDATPVENVIERTSREAHDILFYVDKDDPRGAAPDDPTRDPQFKNWESAVQDWAMRTGWLTPTTTLSAATGPLSISVTSPAAGTHLTAANFPLTVSVNTSGLANASKIDLYDQTPDGSTRLIGSEIGPTTNAIKFAWATRPDPGTYVIFPVLVDTSGNTHPGERTTIFVD